MSDILDRPRIRANQLEMILSGGQSLNGHGMSCDKAGRFLLNLGKLYAELCQPVRFSEAYPEAAGIAQEIVKDQEDFLLPSSELFLVYAAAGSMTFLLEAVATVQSALVSPLPTAIANLVGVLDALKLLEGLLPGQIKRWNKRFAGKDEYELAAISNAIGEIVKVAASVDTITVTTSEGHSVVLEGVVFRKL